MKFNFNKLEELVYRSHKKYCTIDTNPELEQGNWFFIGKTVNHAYVGNALGKFAFIHSKRVQSFDEDLVNCQSVFAFNIPYLPLSLKDKLNDITQYVEKKYNTEFYCSILYDIDTNKFKIFVPEQEVYKYKVQVTGPLKEKETDILVFKYHSHLSTHPHKQSSLDDFTDFDTFSYTAVGHNSELDFSLHMRMCLAGRFFEVSETSCFISNSNVDVDVPSNNHIDSVLIDKSDFIPKATEVKPSIYLDQFQSIELGEVVFIKAAFTSKELLVFEVVYPKVDIHTQEALKKEFVEFRGIGV